MNKLYLWLALVVGITGCAQMKPPTPPPGEGHLTAEQPIPSPDIPEAVRQTPFLPPPEPIPEGELYTVVVNDVPVRELLFALARDAQLNVDLNAGVSGNVTLNAIDQTLPQILNRISHQVDVRYRIEGGTVFVSPDTPYFRTYEVSYVNLSREVETVVNVATRVATTGEGAGEGAGGGGSSGGGGGNNTSSTRLKSTSYNRFWGTLYENILGILGQSKDSGAKSDNVIVNAEAGVITVNATSRQHEHIQTFIDQVLLNARRQVMIEATIVEVSLNDQYQAGVDWRILLDSNKAGIGVNQQLLGGITDGIIDNAISSFVFGYADPNNNGRSIDMTVRLLREFGDARVLSSPRLMALNNQTAVLKVVEELVYFEIEVTNKDSTATSQGSTFVDTQVRSVPVGLVMEVTPQISANDEITLTIRPTISEQIGEAVDPNPELRDISNTVPVIRVREMESVLRLVDGQIGVLGGLMQDEIRSGDREVPGLAKLPILGDMFFNTKESTARKTELVIFLRPVVIRDPSVQTDLSEYRRVLDGQTGRDAL